MKLGKTAILFGTGAVEYSWNPILKAVTPFCKWPKAKPEATIDAANSFFALIVYLLRMAAKTPSKKDLDKLLEAYKKFKLSMCKEISCSMKANEILIRTEFIEMMKLLKKYSTEYRAFTTNWDTVIDGIFENDVIHLHGIFSDPNALYFPTEIIDEPYRSSEECENYLVSHGIALASLAEADSLVIYGLSLSPLDAELSTLLIECLNGKNIRYIFIVDPDHDNVLKRMQFYIQTPNSAAKMYGVPPNSINQIEEQILLNEQLLKQ